MSSSTENAVTVLISRQVKPGCETEFERVMEQAIAAATSFNGYLGAQLVRPGKEQGVNDSLYHTVLSFDSQFNLDAWQKSPVRSLGLAATAPFIEGQAENGAIQLPPPRWKIAVVTWLGIFPTVYILFFLLGDLLAPWPLSMRIMFLTVLVVGLMTWVVAPQLTRLLKPWLYSASRE